MGQYEEQPDLIAYIRRLEARLSAQERPIPVFYNEDLGEVSTTDTTPSGVDLGGPQVIIPAPNEPSFVSVLFSCQIQTTVAGQFAQAMLDVKDSGGSSVGVGAQGIVTYSDTTAYIARWSAPGTVNGATGAPTAGLLTFPVSAPPTGRLRVRVLYRSEAGATVRFKDRKLWVYRPPLARTVV